MKNFMLLVFIFLIKTNLFAQANLSQIQAFENGLMSINDSINQHFNIEERMKMLKVPAVSIAIIEDGKIVLSKAYGYSNMAKKRKADTETLFQAASIGKNINALCIMKLVEDNKLSLTSDFRDYIKDGSFIETEFSKNEKITIANLLSHTSGMNRDEGMDSYTNYDKLPTITQIIKGEKPALGKGAFCISKPNQKYQYSNHAINITQKIVTDLLQSDYNSIIDNMVFQPLQMKNSTFSIKLKKAQQKKLASGYEADYKEVAPWIFPTQAEGGLRATATDIAKVVIAIQNAYNAKENAFLKKETMQKMFTPQLGEQTVPGNLGVPYKYGLGLMLFEKGNQPYFCHSGAIDGYTSLFVGSYDDKKGAVILINSSKSKIIPELLNSIAVAFEWKDFVVTK
jgi:CubicO group peptidase (beta-lactamase class C family)